MTSVYSSFCFFTALAPAPLFYAQVAVGCETGGYSRPDHLGATSRRILASCSRFCARLTASACLVSFSLSCSSLVADCLCALRHLPLVVFLCSRGWLGGLQARWWRLCALMAACRTDLGGWMAPRGAGERDLRGICGGIGRFDDHQTIAASPPPSPPV